MAQPTTEHAAPAARQAQTHGIANQAETAAAQGVTRRRPQSHEDDREDREGQRPPVLFEDIDKVLLLRLFADEIDVSASRAKALAQGIATMEAGVELEDSRIEFDPAATNTQRKRVAVARAQAAAKTAEHGTPQEKEAAAAELKRSQAMPETETKSDAMPGNQTNTQKKNEAIAKAQQAVKDVAEHGTQEQKDAAAAMLKRAQNLPD